MGNRDARKVARRVFRALGATVDRSDSSGVRYLFPDGAAVLISSLSHPGVIFAEIARVQDRYGRAPAPTFATLSRRAGRPTIDLESLKSTAHARERFELMQRQKSVSYRDLVLTLRTPQRVLYSDIHESWVWVGPVLAVAITDDGNYIKTVLWADRQTWDENPRPNE